MAGSPPVSICRIELGHRRQLKKFIKFSWKIYRDDPNWVPPLIFDQLQFFTPGKNPYFSHSKAQLFMAFRGEEPVGRISAHEIPPQQAQPTTYFRRTDAASLPLENGVELSLQIPCGKFARWKEGMLAAHWNAVRTRAPGSCPMGHEKRGGRKMARAPRDLCFITRTGTADPRREECRARFLARC